MANASVLILSGLLLTIICLHVSGTENASQKTDNSKLRGPTETKKRNFYDMQLRDIEGNVQRLEEYRGQVLLVVNVASECGFTDGHYKGLVKLQKIYGKTGKFTVIGIPCNDFGAQEPGSESEILTFAMTKYEVNFPLFSKTSIIGNHAHPVYKYLAEATGTEPNWNFWKYLISHSGEVLNSWGPWVDIESITKTVRSAVDGAVMADPGKLNQQASGPPKKEHKDYGDGRGGSGEVWSEGREKEPSRAGGSTLVHDDL